MSTAGQKKEFLNIMKEAEAIARGANLSEKAHHAVYKTVKSLSMPDQIKKGSVFHAGTHIPELENLSYGKKEYLEVLQRLISDQLIAQVFLLEHDPGDTGMHLTPCYIANVGDEKVTPEQIFQELLMASVGAIEDLIRARPIFTREQIQADFETDIKSPSTPSPDRLTATVIDPLAAIQPSAFDFVPPGEMLRIARSEIQEELIRRSSVVYLLEYGLLPVKSDEILVRFEAATDFLITRILPEHRSNGALKAELQSISSQEEAYHLEGFVKKTAEFTHRKATAVKKHLLSAPGRNSRFPGSLAVETILQLHSHAEKKFKDQWDREMDQQHIEIRESIIGLGVDAADQIRFFSDEDRQSMPPEVWRRLTGDSGFFHSTWERNDGTYHILCKKNPGIFPELVSIMLNMGPGEDWKILAFRFLIEKYESTFPELFQNATFVEAYGRLLRRAYMSLIPWYYRLLMLIGLKSVMDAAFQNAKNRIQEDQSRLAQKNQEKRDTAERQRIIEKKEKAGQAEELELARRLQELLDRFYFQDSRPPSIDEIVAEIADRKAEEVKDFIRARGFRTIDGGEAKILLYPVDHQWRVRAIRLKNHLEQVSQDAGLEASLKARVSAVLKLLQKSVKQAAAGVGSGGDNKLDPDAAFERFETELEKHEGQSRQSAPDDEPY